MTREEATRILERMKEAEEELAKKISGIGVSAITNEKFAEVYGIAISALREQEDHIREVTKKVGWISVEDRLPEDDVDVLTRRATGMSVESHCGFGWAYDEYNGKWRVTHWMPLPEPPEVEV